jgi:hypothetical protein
MAGAIEWEASIRKDSRSVIAFLGVSSKSVRLLVFSQPLKGLHRLAICLAAGSLLIAKSFEAVIA